jgi:hypothetical protein
MRKLVLFALSVCVCVAWVVSAADARKVSNDAVRMQKSARAKGQAPIDGGMAPALHATAAANTTVLASYNWDQGPSCVPQGWVTHDLTTQTGDYVHVDDFAGLGGGSYGLLVPLAGNQSLWIGARANPGDPDLCGYAVLPGYGNGWHQLFCSKCFTLTGNATVSYLASWDSEPGYDFTYAQYAAGCTGTWTDVETINGGTGAYDNQSASTPESFVVTAAQHGGSARFRFDFQADGAWSDSDGLWNTDGAFIVDNLVVQDGAGVQSSQTFENEALDAHGTLDAHWQSCNLEGYGDYAGLLPGISLLQEDPCARDISCQWTFFTGSTANYSCGGYPAVTAIPYGNADGQYLTNEVWSPNIAWTGSGSVGILQFAVYRDLPLDNLVFYIWHVRSIVGGCPQSWLDDNTVYFGDDLDWFQETFSIGQYIEPAATHIQIAIGAWDMCGDWCGSVGSGSCHSHSPMIDNLRVKRVDVAGPQWTVNGWQMFQDNFASDGTVTGTVRMDMSNDLRQTEDPLITPGDSVAAQVVDPVAGLAIDPLTGSGPALYAYVAVHPQGQPGKSGSALTDNASRWPVVGSVVDADGDTWYKVRFDTAYVQNNQTPVQDLYCFDLNDDLFTPGDTVEYFYEAVSVGGATSYFFGGYRALDNFDAAGAIVTTLDIDVAFANPMEVTCLPAAALNNGGDILYVDDGDGRNVQPYFDQAFQMMGILDKVDRYDVRAPSSNVANGPGARVTDAFQQIIPYYKKIIWNSEELEDGTIGDGTGTPDKSDDFELLYTFLNNSTLGPGLYISGDGIADDWANSTAGAATNLRSVYLNFDLVTADHKDLGFGVAPKVIGVGGGAFSHPTGPDTLIAFGGCLGINEFDVLDPTGSAVSQMRYGGDPDASAVISQTTTNGSNATARVVMAGFSFDLIRDDRPTGVMDRVHHLYDMITFLGNAVDQPTGTPTVEHRDALFQNYPNPFNPSTSIEFTVRDRTRVSVKVFDVAGRLVRTLLEDDRAAGAVHRVTWDGRNDAGESVSSGVYFYRLAANNFTQTKKMVLLK